MRTTRGLRSGALAAVAALVLGGCAQGEKEEPAARTAEPTSLSVEASDYRFALPATVTGGLVKLELKNAEREGHEAQLFRIEGGKAVQDVVQTFAQGEGAPIPDFIRFAGGRPAPEAGGDRLDDREPREGRLRPFLLRRRGR